MAWNFGSVVGNIFNPKPAAPQTVVVQAAPAQETKPTEQPNGMDHVAALLKIDPAKQAPADPLAGPLLRTDAKAIQEAANKMDFVGHIPKELMERAMSGKDPDAFMQVLNMSSQRTLAASASLSAATIEQATALNNQRIDKALPQRVASIQLEGMQAENPALNHAAAQPMLKLLRSQIQMQNPGMSPVEINKQAESALLGFATTLAGSAGEGDDAGVRPYGAASTMNGNAQQGGTDWDKWAGLS